MVQPIGAYHIQQKMCSSLGYSGTKFEVATANGLGEDAFTKRLCNKVTQNVAQYPLHCVAYSKTAFEVATFNSLGGDALIRKYIILHTKCCPVSSISCDLPRYKV